MKENTTTFRQHWNKAQILADLAGMPYHVIADTRKHFDDSCYYTGRNAFWKLYGDHETIICTVNPSAQGQAA